jgi:hypothetical protein
MASASRRIRLRLEPRVDETGISAQDIRTLLRSEECRASASQNQQVVFIHDFAQIECGVTLSAAQIGKVFRIEAEQVCKIRWRAGSKGKVRTDRWQAMQVRK